MFAALSLQTGLNVKVSLQALSQSFSRNRIAPPLARLCSYATKLAKVKKGEVPAFAIWFLRIIRAVLIPASLGAAE